MELKTTSSRSLKGFLQEELLKRIRRNPNYSLRAFARHLNIEPSLLSKVLRGKVAVTPRLLDRVSAPLGFSPIEIESFKGAIQNKSDLHDESILQLQQDHFQVISEWYHLAILELTSVAGFKSNVSWIAGTLGLSIVEVSDAIERLKRLGFLSELPNGKWIDQSGNVSTVSFPSTTVALRSLQKVVLKQAIAAIEDVSFEERDQSTMTFAMDETLIPEVKEKIKKFRRSLAQSLQKKSTKSTRVYHMSISFFPISKSFRK